MKKLREQVSEELNMEPGFLLNNAMIFNVASSNPEDHSALKEIDTIRGWQVDALGDRILSTLNHGK